MLNLDIGLGDLPQGSYYVYTRPKLANKNLFRATRLALLPNV